MPVLSLLAYPDPGLSRPCAPVTVFDAGLKRLADDVADTMRAAPGVGITAAHVGVFVRLVVIELERKEGPRIYVNPEILWSSPETATHREGSVSMPGAVEDVTRPSAVRLSYQDIEGNRREEEAKGFLATCIQHEIDQLDGIFWLQRLSRLKRDRVIARWKKHR